MIVPLFVHLVHRGIIINSTYSGHGKLENQLSSASATNCSAGGRSLTFPAPSAPALDGESIGNRLLGGPKRGIGRRAFFSLDS